MLNRSLYRTAALVSILLLVASVAHAQFDPQRFECSGQPVGASCWMEASNRPGCYVLNPEYQGANETLTWTGECAAGLGEGTGTVTFLMSGRSIQVGTGRIQKGLWEGPWVWRDEAGAIAQEVVCGGSVCAETREASDEPAVVVEARETSDEDVFLPGCRTLRRGLPVITSVPHFQDHASDNWEPEGAGSDGVVNRSWSGRRSNMLSWSTCSIW